MANQLPQQGAARQSIEFVVKPTEDLYLEGSLRRLPRVNRNDPYPCQMQKTQTFSCLFRHYAKHNGLRKEDLVFTFVDELLADQSPEGVHLMPGDEIFVSHRQLKPVVQTSESPQLNSFPEHFRNLLRNGEHSDIVFTLEGSSEPARAHKAILSARSEYFAAMFRKDGMAESQMAEIAIDCDAACFSRMLEFVYTNTVSDLDSCNGDDMLNLLVLADRFVMDDLRVACEPRAAKCLTVENISKFLLLSLNKELSVLKKACLKFAAVHSEVLLQDAEFYRAVESNPELGLLLFELALKPSSSDSGSPGDDNSLRKRRRFMELPESEMDLVPPTLNTQSQTGVATNTIAQSNASVQEN